MNEKERTKYVKDQKFGQRCISHLAEKPCKSQYKCSKCDGPHSLLLHFDEESILLTSDKEFTFVFPTAKIEINTTKTVAIIDRCATATFITKRLVKQLKLKE